MFVKACMMKNFFIRIINMIKTVLSVSRYIDKSDVL